MKPGRISASEAEHWKNLTRVADLAVRRVRARLPGPARERALSLPVLLERVPSPEIVSDGFEPDLLGLFCGSAFPEQLTASAPEPSHILLFLENIWDYAEEDPAAFEEEVGITYLHELGHYLGLDEEDLDDRGLQ